MQSRGMALALVLIACSASTTAAHIRLRRFTESPEVTTAQVMPATGPDGCPLLKPGCMSVSRGDEKSSTWSPTCVDGKWVCGEAPPRPTVLPCVIEPPTDPSGCPMAKPMCAKMGEDGKGIEFEPTCRESEGKKKWMCEEPQSETPGVPKACCRAGSAKCLACAAGLSEEEYCAEHPSTAGCPGEPAEPPTGCCRAMSAECLACAAGQTVDEYCEENLDAAGCEWEEDPAEEREYLKVKKNSVCGEKGKPILSKTVASVEECAALAEGEGYDAFLVGKGFKRGRCVGVSLEVSDSMWGAYQNSKRMPPCPGGWKQAKKFDFYVIEPES